MNKLKLDAITNTYWVEHLRHWFAFSEPAQFLDHPDGGFFINAEGKQVFSQQQRQADPLPGIMPLDENKTLADNSAALDVRCDACRAAPSAPCHHTNLDATNLVHFSRVFRLNWQRSAEENLSRIVQRAHTDAWAFNTAAQDNKIIDDTTETLRKYIAAHDRYPNFRYNGIAEFTARMITLYETNPDMYANILRGIAKTEEDVFLDNLRGLLCLSTVVGGLSDDHEYVWDAKNKTLRFHRDVVAETGNHGMNLTCAAEMTGIVMQHQSTENSHFAAPIDAAP